MGNLEVLQRVQKENEVPLTINKLKLQFLVDDNEGKSTSYGNILLPYETMGKWKERNFWFKNLKKEEWYYTIATTV